MLGMEQDATINFTRALAWARAITATINHKGMPCLTFARASQNVAAAAGLLDTLPTPSTSGLNKVYCQLRGILDGAAEQ
jgi:hypothetical protein